MPTFSTPKKTKKKSNKWTYLYALYLGIDNGKLSLSMIKYSFDILLANGDLATKAMQEWMNSPIGATITILSILGSISLSLIAHYGNKEDKKLNTIIIFWTYARDSMKCLRNALRGVGSTINLIYILELQDMRYLIIPIGLFVGGLSVLSRIWIRYKSERYQGILEINTQLLVDLERLNTLSSEQIDSIRRKIRKQSDLFKACSLFTSALSGLIDGINPYIGSLALVTFSPPMLLLVTTFCGAYFFAMLVVRIDEELNLQRQLHITQKKVELALLEKEIELLTHTLTELSEYLIPLSHNRDQFLDEHTTLSIYLNFKLEEQDHELQALSQITQETPTCLLGIKNGLNAYKYMMLTLNTCIFLSPIKLPSLPSEQRALLGISTLSAGIIYYFSSSFLHHWLETIKTYCKQNNTQENCDEIPKSLARSTGHNANRFFSHPKQQELNYFTPGPCRMSY